MDFLDLTKGKDLILKKWNKLKLLKIIMLKLFAFVLWTIALWGFSLPMLFSAESNVHNLGFEYDISEIIEFEALAETEKADSFS